MHGGQLLPAMPAPGFRFVVAVDGAPMGAFTECTLPSFDMEVETVKEGGLNTYVHQLPGQRRAVKLTLKNGVGVAKSLLTFYQLAMSERYARLEVTVTLLNPMLMPIMRIISLFYIKIYPFIVEKPVMLYLRQWMNKVNAP